PDAEYSREATESGGSVASSHSRGDPANRQGLQPTRVEVHRHRIELDRLRLSECAEHRHPAPEANESHRGDQQNRSLRGDRARSAPRAIEDRTYEGWSEL